MTYALPRTLLSALLALSCATGSTPRPQNATSAGMTAARMPTVSAHDANAAPVQDETASDPGYPSPVDLLATLRADTTPLGSVKGCGAWREDGVTVGAHVQRVQKHTSQRVECEGGAQWRCYVTLFYVFRALEYSETWRMEVPRDGTPARVTGCLYRNTWQTPGAASAATKPDRDALLVRVGKMTAPVRDVPGDCAVVAKPGQTVQQLAEAWRAKRAFGPVCERATGAWDCSVGYIEQIKNHESAVIFGTRTSDEDGSVELIDCVIAG